jgi:hypothetical protein
MLRLVILAYGTIATEPRVGATPVRHGLQDLGIRLELGSSRFVDSSPVASEARREEGRLQRDFAVQACIGLFSEDLNGA